jgi:hypothetical protein
MVSAGRVIGRKRELDGTIKGISNANPILGVEFPDGSEAEYLANSIAKNMWAQSDFEGNQYIKLEVIVDHQKDRMR